MYFPYAFGGSPWPEVVQLDLDDVTSFGPETTTLFQEMDGVYRFYVHDYTNRNSTNSTALSNSQAQVRVYRGNALVASFNVPQQQEGTLWTVFEMENGIVSPINTMSYTAIPSGIGVQALVAPADAEQLDGAIFLDLPEKAAVPGFGN